MSWILDSSLANSFMYYDPGLFPLMVYKGSKNLDLLSNTLGRCTICKEFQDAFLSIPDLCSRCQRFSHKRCRTSGSLALRQSCLECNTAFDPPNEGGSIRTERVNNPRRAQGDTSTSISRKRPRATIPDTALESEDEMISPMNGVPRRAISRGTPSRVVQETVTVLGKPRGHQKADISFGKALYDKGTRAGGIQKQRRGSGTRSVLQVLTGNRYSNGRDLSDEDAKLSQPCPGRTARSRTRRGGGG